MNLKKHMLVLKLVKLVCFQFEKVTFTAHFERFFKKKTKNVPNHVPCAFKVILMFIVF